MRVGIRARYSDEVRAPPRYELLFRSHDDFAEIFERGGGLVLNEFSDVALRRLSVRASRNQAGANSKHESL